MRLRVKLSVRLRLILRNSVAETKTMLAGMLEAGTLAIDVLVAGTLAIVGTGYLTSLNVGIAESNARVQIIIMRAMMALISRIVMRVPFLLLLQFVVGKCG